MNETPTEVHIGEHAPVFYTNTIAVEVSGTDAKLVIGQIKSVKQGRSVVVQDVAHIYMTREHLRAMAGVLASVVATMDAKEQAQPVFISLANMDAKEQAQPIVPGQFISQ